MSVEDWTPANLEIEKNTYTVEEILEWHEGRKLVLSPEFQRGDVWKTPAKAFLIDTILRGFPIPPLHIRLVQRGGQGLMREVIDGQQRVNSVIGFATNVFRLSRPRTSTEPLPPWAGLYFKDLEPALQDRFMNYSFRCEVYKGNIGDPLIYEIFSRINTYTVPLSDQELRNGRFFGEFKRAAYSLAHEHAEFWRAANIFSPQSIARMLDAEFVSEALVCQLDGMQDKKASLNAFYSTYELEWPERTEHEDRFRATIDAIRTAVGDLLPATRFSRAALFYTLYAVVYHRLYGIPTQRIPEGEEALPRTPLAALDPDSSERLRFAVQQLSEALSAPKESAGRLIDDFKVASSRQTDNLRPRLIRFRTLWSLAGLTEK